jgi:hypothetical protein
VQAHVSRRGVHHGLADVDLRLHAPVAQMDRVAASEGTTPSQIPANSPPRLTRRSQVSARSSNCCMYATAPVE